MAVRLAAFVYPHLNLTSEVYAIKRPGDDTRRGVATFIIEHITLGQEKANILSCSGYRGSHFLILGSGRKHCPTCRDPVLIIHAQAQRTVCKYSPARSSKPAKADPANAGSCLWRHVHDRDQHAALLAFMRGRMSL